MNVKNNKDPFSCFVTLNQVFSVIMSSNKSRVVTHKENTNYEHPRECKEKFNSFLRKIFRLGKKKAKGANNNGSNNDFSSKNVDSYFKSSSIHFSSSNSSTNKEVEEFIEKLPNLMFKQPPEYNFIMFPLQVRKRIYSLVSYKDLLTLRLTNKELKTDIETYHGIILTLHDGKLEFEKPFQTLPLWKLTVEHFTSEAEAIYSTFFPRPHLLKTLTLSGPVTQRNIEFMLQIFFNLTTLTINMDQLGCSFTRACSLDALKTLEISSSQDSLLATKSVGNLMKYINCPVVSTFKFRIIGCSTGTVNELHALAKIFILQSRKSLKEIDINIFETEVNPLAARTASIVFGESYDLTMSQWTNAYEESGYQFNLERIELTLNANMAHWSAFINIQQQLTVIKLNVLGQQWNRLIPILINCGETLKTFSVSNLSSAFNGVYRVPLDMYPMTNTESLEILEITHVPSEFDGFGHPSIIRTSRIPRTLKSVKISHIQLKPYQALFFFLKLPHLRDLTLDFWSDTESTLEGFLAVLIFLIKFDQTQVTQFKMTDFRRKLENIEVALTRMGTMLKNHAKISQTSSELYSTLSLTRF